jgi:hypothetical protein
VTQGSAKMEVHIAESAAGAQPTLLLPPLRPAALSGTADDHPAVATPDSCRQYWAAPAVETALAALLLEVPPPHWVSIVVLDDCTSTKSDL